MDVHEPEDKNNGMWLIFFMLGLGTLLPWNFFMTATMYFTSRLRDPTQISTNKPYDRSPVEASYNNVSTLCAMVPLLIFTCLNSVLHHRIPQKFRIMGSLVVILVLFLITAIMVKIDMAAVPFFTLTMIKIVIINSFGAILQGSLFGMAGLLPAKYTTPIMSGQGLAGTFAAFSMICAIASGSALNDVAFGYFLTACVVIILAIMSYAVLPKLEFYQYYNKRQSGNRLSKEVNRLEENAAATTTVLKQGEEEQTMSMLTIFKKIWVLALSVCFAFTVTIGVYPAVTVDVKSTVANGGAWEMYFIPVCCFLLFNLSDWAGRSLTAVCMWPGKDSKLVPIFMVARVIFVPLFMLCNVQPRYNLPVVFQHDAWFVVFMILFAFSSGYLASLCMCFGPKLVAPHEAETAGAIMAFFLSLGLALGASFSFLFRAIV
ncbi:equilibrative nucleoside transporter 1 isoform X1 [Salmo salar]|uniref:Equilibrative nucleoside transporter 1 isoform X1 n=1 Tax=Salmo salar TaxID=8030 RepID=A0A1S3NE99_SALSA|nr:equilibrative nucleoside transporter 1-like isoform X1 [Salmo salar]|eukprot:XP_014013461.1 PREDICTED: equilibrative nucleoside transporter 1-like [Salmo salar]